MEFIAEIGASWPASFRLSLAAEIWAGVTVIEGTSCAPAALRAAALFQRLCDVAAVGANVIPDSELELADCALRAAAVVCTPGGAEIPVAEAQLQALAERAQRCMEAFRVALPEQDRRAWDVNAVVGPPMLLENKDFRNFWRKHFGKAISVDP